MHRTVLVVLLVGVAGAGLGWSQALTEAAAAAAGGSVGGVAGKKVSDSLTSIFNQVDKQTSKAAETDAAASPRKKDAPSAPVLDAGTALPKSRPHHVESVPPPPPPLRRADAVPKRARTPPPPPASEVTPVPPPPPPEVTAEDLKKVTPGMNREDVLKLGPPVYHITMFDDGHLVEVYRYMTGGTSLGVVRLTDGAVSGIQVR